MSRTKKGAQVIIVRKDKRINHKLLHGLAFAVTGGASGIVTAAEAANHAAYNARTRQLQEAAEPEPDPYADAHRLTIEAQQAARPATAPPVHVSARAMRQAR